MTDDDIRSMLQAKAQEATVSDDAWAKIALRLATADAPVRHLPRRMALVAAAAVVATVVVANLPDSNGPITNATTTTAVDTADTAAIEQAAATWLAARLPGVDAGPAVVRQDGDTAGATFKDGKVATELFLTRPHGTRSWEVIQATSDNLVLLDDPTYDGTEIVAEAVPAVEGELTTTYVIDGREVPGGNNHVTHETQALGHLFDGAQSVAVRVVLVMTDGTIAIAELPATILRDPATATGSYVAIWPATDAVGLHTFQQQADAGRRKDLLDPQAVAGYFLTEAIPRSEAPPTWALGDFRQADPTSGEVPYTLDGKPAGEIQVRRAGGDDSIWYVTGATSDALEVLKVRHEPNDLVVDVQSKVTGTLTWVSATPIDVKAGQKVSISRPERGTIQTGYPIVLRLMDGTKTLAVLAQLPT